MNKAKVHETKNYSLFKRLLGNRSVSKSRVEKIKSSIMDVGYVMNPIIVNDRHEVIDGQGRLQALRELGLPVHYIVVDGIGVRECISMNVFQSNWKLRDYVESYAEQGHPDYVRFLQLLEKYESRGVDIRAVTAVISKGLGEVAAKVIMDGGLVFPDSEFEQSEQCLEYISKFTDIIKGAGIKSLRSYQSVLAWAFFNPDMDKQALLAKVNRYRAMLCTVADIPQALDVIEQIYNFRTRHRYYLSKEYYIQKDANSKKKTA